MHDRKKTLNVKNMIANARKVENLFSHHIQLQSCNKKVPPYQAYHSGGHAGNRTAAAHRPRSSTCRDTRQLTTFEAAVKGLYRISHE